MYKGDISNEIPMRVLVTTDLFIDTQISDVKEKKLFKTKITRKTHAQVRADLLSRLWLYNDRTPYTLECVSYTFDAEQMIKLEEQLDVAGTNPFRYFTSYSSMDQLIKTLPYRPEVLGVIDKPDRLLRYGHWGMDMTRL